MAWDERTTNRNGQCGPYNTHDLIQLIGNLDFIQVKVRPCGKIALKAGDKIVYGPGPGTQLDRQQEEL